MKATKVFSRLESECRKMNLFSILRKQEKNIGDMGGIKFATRSKSRSPECVTSFIHPRRTLFRDLSKKDTMVKTFFECIEVFPQRGLPRRKDNSDKSFTFLATGERSKVCVVIPKRIKKVEYV